MRTYEFYQSVLPFLTSLRVKTVGDCLRLGCRCNFLVVSSSFAFGPPPRFARTLSLETPTQASNLGIGRREFQSAITFDRAHDSQSLGNSVSSSIQTSQLCWRTGFTATPTLTRELHGEILLALRLLPMLILEFDDFCVLARI